MKLSNEEVNNFTFRLIFFIIAGNPEGYRLLPFIDLI